MSKMALRIILPSFIRHHNCNASLNIIRAVFQKRFMICSFLLPAKHSNYIFHEFHLKHSGVVTTDEVESLCHFILSDIPDCHRCERFEELKKVITFLLSKGYSTEDIIEKFLEYLKSDYYSYVKFTILDDIDSDIVMLLPLLSLPVTVLKVVANKFKADRLSLKELPNRFSYLSHHLELEPSQLLPVLAKHPAILTMKFYRLEKKMSILKNANINSKYIVKDLWIFNYTEELLAHRIQAALKSGVELKPWMLRCSGKFFESILLKYSETQRILKGKNVDSYLAEKLDCSIEYVNYMMERNKLLKTINIPKIEQIVNFLFAKGYKPEEVRIFPRVFCSSVKTLEKRFEELHRLKSTLPTLAQLCMSNKKLRSTLEKDD